MSASGDRTRRLIGGDALRGAAAIGVICGHVAAYALYAVDGTAAPGSVGFDDFIGHYGAVGVVLSVVIKSVWVFFVLSGYLVARPAIAAWCAGRPLPPVGAYVRNRLLRIVPAFWVMVVVTLLVLGTQGAGPLELAAVVLFAQTYAGSDFGTSIGQAWTLGAELTFYLLVPVAGFAALTLCGRRLGRRGRVTAVVLAAAAIFVASLAAGLWLGRDEQHLRWAPAILFAFMPGVMLAALEQILPRHVRDRRGARGLALGVVLGGFALFAVAGMPGTPSGTGRLVVVVGSGAILAGILLRQWADGTCWRILDNAPLRWVGVRSYSTYLLHLLAIQLFLEHVDGGSDWSVLGWLTLLTLAATLPAAALLYRWVELPFLRIRARGARRAEPAAELPGPVAGAVGRA
jgi:peptidoglycan/LPS O-acetylase OafA/YrhL